MALKTVHLSNAALTDYKDNHVMEIVPLTSETACSLACRAMRGEYSKNYKACNTFFFEAGLCYLGYADPQWVVDSEDPNGDNIIFTDAY